MTRETYHKEKEHEIIGMYPPVKGMDQLIPEAPRFYRPIGKNQNMQLLFEGKTPYWIPNSGWFLCDICEFRPRQHPDNIANHQAIDGGDPVDYNALGDLQYGWFDMPLEWEAVSMGATVRPGNPKFTDMNDWETAISMPDLDQIDWAEMKEMNKEFLSTDKHNQLGIQLGLWERMMCLMDTDNAALALLDEDQEDAIHQFLDVLSDVYVDYIKRASEIGRIDGVMLHDDWGTSNGPFFSLETCRKFFVSPMKKIVDFCHTNGMIFEHHCCGKAEKLVPAMVECGTDCWFPQPAINDVDQLIADYKNEHLTFVVGNPLLPVGSSAEDVRNIAKAWVDKYKDAGILMIQDINWIYDPACDLSLFPIFEDAVYEFSRIAYQNAIN